MNERMKKWKYEWMNVSSWDMTETLFLQVQHESHLQLSDMNAYACSKKHHREDIGSSFVNWVSFDGKSLLASRFYNFPFRGPFCSPEL